MSINRNKTTVTIYNQQYDIVSSESIEHIHLVASIVDEKIRELNEKNPYLGQNRLAILTAVNAVHDLIKLEEKNAQLEEEINKLKG
ncbi:cell division protein ZapA [Falsibacillus albus]|uniref:Cell division protein ZapA n=1 Tax=Falsibacillus albus TaxID=2478915 RepID=A0A3L7K4P0_9BACI|nr:cell division protein ZapA [Falsibacillus albus]RLQ97998.1 cell division protein ZapA [Falsibacillus albus]